jgi:hypothetical protein
VLAFEPCDQAMQKRQSSFRWQDTVGRKSSGTSRMQVFPTGLSVRLTAPFGMGGAFALYAVAGGPLRGKPLYEDVLREIEWPAQDL